MSSKSQTQVDSDFFEIDINSDSEHSGGILTGDPEKDHRNVMMLLATINAVNSMVDIQDLTVRIADMMIQLTSADRCILLLKENDRDDDFQISVARNHNHEDIQELTQFSRSIPQQVFETGEPVCLVDALQEDAGIVGGSIHELELRTVMCTPLRVRNRIFGVMYVDSKIANKEFETSDLNLFEALGQQVAIALENARLTQAMLQAEKLAAVGQMTSMIIHDLKNPMTVLFGYASLLQSRKMDQDATAQLGMEIETAVTRIVDMLQSLLDYSRGRSHYELQTLNFKTLVQETFERLMSEFTKSEIKLNLDLQYEDDLTVDPDNMERVFTNLTMNAIDAMEKGETLTVRTRRFDEDRVEIKFSDTGKGIRSEILPKIFDPFITDGKKHGTGLGLAIVKKIVEAHNGKISVNSEEGHGTQFQILLPLQLEQTS